MAIVGILIAPATAPALRLAPFSPLLAVDPRHLRFGVMASDSWG
jgi:hypothetical protein